MGGFQYGFDTVRMRLARNWTYRLKPIGLQGVMGGLLALKSFQKSFRLDQLDPVQRGNQNANIVTMLQA